MLKELRGILGLLLVIAICSGSIVAVNAENVNESTPKEIYSDVSEYDMIQELSKMSKSRLRKDGYSEKEIDVIEDYDTYASEQIKSMKDYETEQLGRLGYNESQIKIIKNFTGTTAEIQKASAKCTASMTINYCEYSKKRGTTRSKVLFKFSWNGVPIIKMTDAMAISWNGWHQIGKGALVTYKHNNGTKTKTKTPSYKEPDEGVGYGGGYTFKAAIEDNYYYASSGYCYFVLERTNKNDMYTGGALGHSTIKVTPSFSVGKSGAIPSITFKKGVTKYSASKSKLVTVVK